MRFAALVLAVTLIGVAPASPPDRFPQLVGSWTCLRGLDRVTKVEVTTEGDTIVATESGTTPRDRFSVTDRYRPDPSTGGWSARMEPSPGVLFTGTGPAFDGNSWTMSGTLDAPSYWTGERMKSRQSMRYVVVDDKTFYRGTADDGAPHGVRGEVCSRGETAPDVSQCAAGDSPAGVLSAAQVTMPAMAEMSRVTGDVQVLVSLDENSHVVSAVVQKSPSLVLNASAVTAARTSSYRTEIKNCRYVPASYLFVVTFSSN